MFSLKNVWLHNYVTPIVYVGLCCIYLDKENVSESARFVWKFVQKSRWWLFFFCMLKISHISRCYDVWCFNIFPRLNNRVVSLGRCVCVFRFKSRSRRDITWILVKVEIVLLVSLNSCFCFSSFCDKLKVNRPCQNKFEKVVARFLKFERLKHRVINTVSRSVALGLTFQIEEVCAPSSLLELLLHGNILYVCQKTSRSNATCPWVMQTQQCTFSRSPTFSKRRRAARHLT